MVTVVVATYGDESVWRPLADRAVFSATAQTVPVKIVRVHGRALHEARNTALAEVDTELVIYLDADDTLDSKYVEKMLEAEGDVRVPSVCYLHGYETKKRPIMPRVAGHKHECSPNCLIYGNWIVVGAMARTDLLCDVGGWREFEMYEDWDIWLRCYKAGASITPVPEALYLAKVRQGSRNRGKPRELRLRTHQAIARANGVPVPA